MTFIYLFIIYINYKFLYSSEHVRYAPPPVPNIARFLFFIYFNTASFAITIMQGSIFNDSFLKGELNKYVRHPNLIVYCNRRNHQSALPFRLPARYHCGNTGAKKL